MAGDLILIGAAIAGFNGLLALCGVVEKIVEKIMEGKKHE